jgi:hypothetical protein
MPTDYDNLMSSGYVLGLHQLQASSPRAYWLKNKSNKDVTIPDIVGWIVQHKSLEKIFSEGSKNLKAASLAMVQHGTGVKDASAVTLMIAEYQLKEGLKVKETRTALLGSSSLNYRVSSSTGQVHAEHITVGSMAAKLTGTEITKTFDHYGTIKLSKVKVLNYVGEPGRGNTTVTDFPPCPSCQQTLSDELKALKTGGAAVELYGLTTGIDF